MYMPGGGGTDLAVTLDEVKRHLNITTTDNDDELPGFIETAQEMIEGYVGPVVPRTFTEIAYASRPLSLTRQPVQSITSIVEYGATVNTGLYVLDTATGGVVRLDGRGWQASAAYPLTVTYVAGHDPLPANIKWGILELTMHLWRSSQTQRGGRSRSDGEAPNGAPFGIPNRVMEAIERYLLIPAVG